MSLFSLLALLSLAANPPLPDRWVVVSVDQQGRPGAWVDRKTARVDGEKVVVWVRFAVDPAAPSAGYAQSNVVIYCRQQLHQGLTYSQFTAEGKVTETRRLGPGGLGTIPEAAEPGSVAELVLDYVCKNYSA